MSVDQQCPNTAQPALADGPVGPLPRHRVNVVVWVLLGLTLAQAAWILALPPFRGTDEFNHVFRAASVARGEWRPPHHVAEYGRGDLVRVPNDIVAAAYAQCASLSYTFANDCSPVRAVGDGQVLIATSASRYMPIYYWLVGTAALPFKGTTALYAMRIASSILCSIFIGLAVWSVRRWARTAWPIGSVLLALTPVAIFSTVVVAPNGPEICAAVAVWCAAIGLTRARTGTDERRLLYLMIPSAVVLAVVRPLGPGFILLALGTCVLAQGPGRCWRVVRRNPRPSLLLAGTIAAAVMINVYWLSTSALSQVAMRGHHPDALLNSLRLIPSQFLQVYAAFPYRDVPAPTIVYACMVLTSLAALLVGLGQSSRRLKVILAAATLAVFVGPFLFTLMTYASKSSFWQGRYGLPFIVGIPLLVGLALDRRPPGHRLVKPLTTTCLTLVVIAQVVSPKHVMDLELIRPASVDDPTWVHPSAWVVALMMILASAAGIMALREYRTESSVVSSGGRRHRLQGPRSELGALNRRPDESVAT